MGILSKNNSGLTRVEKIEKLNEYFGFSNKSFDILIERYSFLKEISARSSELGIGFLLKENFMDDVKNISRSDDFKNLIIDSIYFLK